MKFIFYFITLCLLISVQADLPIHCLKSQTVGKWQFFLSAPSTNKTSLENNCGHEVPDHERSSYLSMRQGFDIYSTATLKLHENGCVEYIKGNGANVFRFKSKSRLRTKVVTNNTLCVDGPSSAWTMVYDEGFEVRFRDFRFFSFQYYFPTLKDKTKFKSNCSKTCVGWYRNAKTGALGCFKAEMIEKSSKVNYINNQTKQLIVVQNKVEQKESFIFKTKDHHSKKSSSPSSLTSKNHNYFNKYNKQRNSNSARFKSFTKEKLSLSSSFTDHLKIIQRLNQHPANLWTASLHPAFQFLSISELNRMAGRVHHSQKMSTSKKEKKFTKKKIARIEDEVSNQDVLTEKKNSNSINKIKTENVDDLPRDFTWRKYLSEPGEQGSCGSCYAISTLKMLEARLRIHSNISTELSTEYAVQCSYYNQGCEGGYSVLISKFGMENYLVDKSCKVKKSKEGQCDITHCNETPKFKIKDYWYIGGNYGQCSERKMMEEIIKNGPIVVSFEPDYTFMLYGKGIYNSPKEKSWIFKGEEKPEWYKVDHSVLCYGWGEENGEKYWLLMNSWGKSWGEKGHFKIKKGIDELGVEFIGESAMPYQE